MLGFIGLGVMGDNLVLNLLDKGQEVLIYNRTSAKTEEFMNNHSHQSLAACYSIKEFCEKLPTPRIIFLMIKAGDAVDQLIGQLIPFLDKGDLIVDGGNSFYKDSIRRYEHLKSLSINYIDCGVSGGAKGARLGPSMMVGGDKHAYSIVAPIFSKIAAQHPNLCMARVGDSGFGHFVKMVHNGIEYAQMQLIAESFQLLRRSHALPNSEIAKIFLNFNRGRLNSYLMEISADILNYKENDDYLVDRILDVASEKGTGRWTSLAALELGAPSSLITAALEARFISKNLEQREKLNSLLFGHQTEKVIAPLSVDLLESSLYLASLLCFMQGLDLIRHYAQVRQVDVDLAQITTIWRGGCIIRSRQLEHLHEIVNEGFFYSHSFIELAQHEISNLEKIVSMAALNRQPIPLFSAAMNYLLTLSEVNSGASLIQAQRDYFGSHTYQRVDQDGDFHTEWEK